MNPVNENLSRFKKKIELEVVPISLKRDVSLLDNALHREEERRRRGVPSFHDVKTPPFQ